MPTISKIFNEYYYIINVFKQKKSVMVTYNRRNIKLSNLRTESK